MITTELIAYKDQDIQLEGFAAYTSGQIRPAVILCHAWKGRDDYICEKAKLIASWGYSAFALDMYGKGVLGHSKEENAALKAPFIKDRGLLLRRVLKGFEIAQGLPFVDPNSIATLGFGFGGICALDLARSGANLKGAISVYGHFEPPALSKNKIKAKVLALHGYNDKIVSQQELLNFEREMDEAGVDWQVHIYGNTLHAFANPLVNDPTSGLMYNPKSAERAWISIQDFLREILNDSSRTK